MILSKNMTIAAPIPGYHLPPVKDGYNFYLSQLRITIERVFSILVHRWGIRWCPLGMSALKVAELVTCLMRLYKYCVDANGSNIPGTMNGMSDERSFSGHVNEANIQKTACWRFCASSHDTRCRRGQQAQTTGSTVDLDAAGSPGDIMGSGHHFNDEPGKTG